MIMVVEDKNRDQDGKPEAKEEGDVSGALVRQEMGIGRNLQDIE